MRSLKTTGRLILPRRHKTQIVYVLAKDGKIIADDDAKVSFE